jgi:hypothetical protein
MLWAPGKTILFIKGSFFFSFSLENEKFVISVRASFFPFGGFFPSVLCKQWQRIVSVLDGSTNVKTVFGDD